MMLNATFNNISVISWRSVRHEITEILLKVALNIKIPNPIPNQVYGAKPNNKLIRT
jgi:hypothetical protein